MRQEPIGTRPRANLRLEVAREATPSCRGRSPTRSAGSALSFDGIVLLKLTPMAHTFEVLDLISRHGEIALKHAEQVLTTLPCRSPEAFEQRPWRCSLETDAHRAYP